MFVGGFGTQLIEEDEFARLYDDGYYWIIEDKTLGDKEVVHTGETKTLVTIKMDFVLVNDRLAAARVYYPKDQFTIDDAKKTFIKVNTERKKEFMKYREQFG